MSKPLTRREFLQVSGLALGSLALRQRESRIPPDDLQPPIGFGRVTIWAIGIFQKPSYRSQRVNVRLRDEVLPLYSEVPAKDDNLRNRRWYRVPGGYAHSAYLQRVEEHYNPIPITLPANEFLGEITIPFSQAYRYTKTYGWQPVYRLYYKSVHWVTGLDEGPNGQAWYRLTDDLLKVDYHVPAAHVRLIPPKELAPLAGHTPPEEKQIVVSLKRQRLRAYEQGRLVLSTLISSGIPSSQPTDNGIPTATPRGRFSINLKMPVRHMGNGNLTNDLSAYELPGVPWVCFFHKTGVAFHGTYWHDNFGSPMSHGCVNMRMEDAKWLFRWTTPVNHPPAKLKKGLGTRVIVE